MGRKLTKQITAIVATVCILVTSCLLGGCVDLHGKKEKKYMIEYMEAIPITCTEYKLALRDDSKYSSRTDEYSGTIIIDGAEKIIDIKWNNDKGYILTIDEDAIDINKEFMAEKSAEYVTISEMWYRYDDRMDDYHDTMPKYDIDIFDKCLFIITKFRQGGGSWWFRYNGSMPACLFKYDIENDNVLYCGCLITDNMSGEYQIEKVEQQ